jgi:AcrR family transcriptional regulator
MPKLWSETIATHRQEVGEAILASAAELVSEHGLRSVTMSQIAATAGIGRATLYKYFPDLDAILVAWHERHVARHLDHLRSLRDGGDPPTERLAMVLEAYAHIQHKRHANELSALLHQDRHAAPAQKQLSDLIEGLLVECREVGSVRGDVPPDELANFCIHALGAAGALGSEEAVQSLVAVTLGGLQPYERIGVRSHRHSKVHHVASDC